MHQLTIDKKSYRKVRDSSRTISHEFPPNFSYYYAVGASVVIIIERDAISSNPLFHCGGETDVRDGRMPRGNCHSDFPVRDLQPSLTQLVDLLRPIPLT